MALARFDQQDRAPSENYKKVEEMPVGRAMARVCGYMAIAVAITAAVAVGIAALMYYVAFGQHNFDEVVQLFRNGQYNAGVIGYLVVFGVCFIILLIMSFLMPKFLLSGKHSAWPAFIIYSMLMGGMLSCFVLLVDIATLGQALGISFAAFLIMFLIGRFSKVNLNPLGLVAIGILFVAVFIGLFTALFYWLNPVGFSWFNLVFNIIVCGVMMIITAVDAYNIKKTLEQGRASNNVLLFCAYSLYCDFISILIRVLLILMRSKR